MKKRVLSLVLVLVMLLGLLPSAALAAPEEEPPQAESLTSGEIAQLPAAEEDAPAQLTAVSPSSVQPKIVLAGAPACRYHKGGDWNNGFGRDNDGPGCGSYDGGIRNAVNSGSSATINLKERDHFKDACYLLQPFTLSVEVPAYTTYAVTFKADISLNRNAYGASWCFMEMADNTNGAAYNNLFSTQNKAGIFGPGSKFRSRTDSRTYAPSLVLKPISFANDTAQTKTVSLSYALVVGNSKSGSALKSYHHQLESRLTLTTNSVAATKRITYNNNGGSGSALAQSFSSDSITLAAAPTKTGYDFLGWKDSVDGKVYAAGAAYSLNRGAALTAQWKAKSLNVTFDANGGTVSQGQKSVTYGETYGTLPTPTRTGYQFEGWTSGPTGGQVYYAHTRVTETKDHTLYAYWTVKVPTVTFNANGGSVSQTSKRAVYGDPYGALPTPTRTGYTFDGWYTAQTGGNKVESTTKVANGDAHTLYARWSVKTVAVTLKYNDGATADGSLSLTYGGKYVGLTDPTRAGYAFTGWYTAASGGSRVTADTAVTNANAHTLYARWSRTTYTVTFNANGGSAVESRKVNAGDKLGTLPTSTKAGYTLGGWFSGDTQITKDTVPTADVTYTAKWTANQYTVTFNANGGTVSQTSMTVTSGLTYGTLPTPTRTGYTFNGWFTAATGGQEMTDNTYFQKAANQTLYAHWTANQYTVTLKVNDNGITADATREVTYGETYGANCVPAVTRTGYTLDGWYTAPVGGAKVATSTTVATASDHTLYAHWTAKTMTVTFDLNGGALPEGVATAKTVTFDQPYGSLPVPTQSGKTFAGWFTATSKGQRRTADSLVTAETNHTLYAIWSSRHSHSYGPGAGASKYGDFVALSQTGDSSKGILAVNDVLGKEIGGTPGYYLTEDVTVDATTTVTSNEYVNGSLTICLNGHKLTYTGDGDSIFEVNDHSTLDICDCNGSDGSHTITSPVTGESVTIQGGLITRSVAKTSVGTGVRVYGGGTFNLYGGAIAGIQAVDPDPVTHTIGDGTVRVEGAFHMYGGEICHNKIGCGAAVNICDTNGSTSHFYLHGGSIHHNYACLDDGGGVCVNQNAACTISGGSITDNRAKSGGGGIHSYGGAVNLSGGTISGNTVGESASSKTPSDIRLDQVKDSEGNFIRDAKLTVSEGFSSAKPIGVSAVSAPTADSPVAVGTDGTGTYARYFTADTAGQEVVDYSGVLALKLHSHPACGGSCTHGDHTAVDYTALTAEELEKVKQANGTYSLNGNYMLTDDLTIASSAANWINASTVNLCLNGHTLTLTQNLAVSSGSTLNICDCTGTGKIQLSTSESHSLSNYGTLNLYSGTVSSYSYPIQNNRTGTVNIYGGTITATSTGGSGIVNNGSDAASGNGTVNVYGGTLTSGWFGIKNDGVGTVTVSGGTITGANSGIRNNNGTFTVSGGTITGKGSGIYNSGTVNVSDGAITGETYGISNDGTLTVSGGTITATSARGINNIGALTVSGGTITGESVGIYQGGSGTLTLSDSPAIQGKSGDIFYVAGAIDASGLTEGAVYSVQPEAVLKEGEAVTFTAADTKDNSAHFIPYRDGEGIRDVVDGESKHTLQLYKQHLHDGEEYENYTLLPSGVESLDDKRTLQSGKYLLTDDVDSAVIIPAGATVDLCLNGKNLSFLLDVQGTLNLYDCAQTPGTLCGNQSGYITVGTNGILNWYGGQMSGGKTIYGTVTLRGAMTSDISYLPVRFAPGVTITKDAPVIAAKNWTEHMGSSSMRYECEYGKYAVAEVNGDGDLVLRLIQVTMDGKTVCPDYDTGTLTADDLAAPENRVGYVWNGWYTAEEEGDPVTADTVFRADATLYPRWTACDHSGHDGTGITTVDATCTTAGSSTYTCSVCGLDVVTVTDALTHDFESDKTWKIDTQGGVHYHKCSRCDQRQDEAEHTWNGGTVTTAPTADAEGVMTFTCTVCGATTTEAIPALVAHTVTYEVDDYTVGETPTQADTVKGGVFSLPTALTRTGYTLSGWALLDAEGVPTVDEDGKEVLYTGTFTMPDRDVTFQIRWTRVPNYELQPGDTIVLEDGTTVTNDSGKTVTIQQGGEDGSKTVITLPDGQQTVTIGQDGDNGKDEITVPPGAEVTTTPGSGEQGPTITIGDGDGKVDPSGKVDAPVGTVITDQDGNTITITGGEGGQIGPDGIITFPEGTEGTITVTDKDGNTTEVDVPGGGEGAEVAPGGLLTVNDPSGTVSLVDPDGGGVTTITVPGDGVITDDGDGSYTVPGGSSVTKTDSEGNQTQLTLPDGGQVGEDGNVTLPEGGQVKVTDPDGNVTTITVPSGGSVGTDEEGNVVAPPGSTVTDPSGATTELPNGGTVEPGGGSVEVIHTWGKWTLQPDGVTLKRVCSTNTTHVQTATLAVAVDEGPFVYSGAAHKPEVTLTAGETALTLGRDYTVAYQNNVNAGTATLTVTGQGSYELSLERSFTIAKATPPQADPGHFNITNGVEREYNYLLSLLCPQINEDVVTADRKEWGERVYTVEDVSFTEDGYYDADKAPAYIGRAQESGAYINRLYLPIQAASSRTEGQVGTLSVKISSANYEDFTNTVAVMATNKAAVDFTGFTTPDKTYDGAPYEYEGAVEVKDSDGYTVSADVEITYAGRGDTGYAERETPPVNAGEFAMIVRVADSDPNYAGRRSSNFVIRKAPGQGSVTMEGYTEGQRGTEPVPSSETNGVEHVSYQYKAKGGPEETYTAVKPTRAGEYTVRATFAATLNYTEATATADFTVSKAALPDDPNALKPGQSVDLPGGGSVENKGDGTVEITDKDGGKTTVTLPQGGDATVKVDKDTGAVTLPGGSTVTIPDGQGGKTEVTLPESGGAVKPTGDGKVEVPAGSTVKKPDGSTLTVPDGGGVIDPATGDVTPAGPDDPTPPSPSTSPDPDDPTPPSPSAQPRPSRPSGSSSTSNKPSVSTSGQGGKVEADRNGNVTITPDQGYQIDKVTVNGKEVTVPEDGKLTGLKRTDKVVVTFKELPTVTVEQFTDVEPADWFYDSVKAMAEQGLMNGTSQTTFAPNLTTSRAMIATILWRLAGSPEAKTALTYPDCVADSWYARAVAWAAESGVVKGYDNGNFGPDDPITREQLAVMLYRYAGSPETHGALGRFTDSGKAGSWATDALRWAVEEGILTGKGGGVLDPAGRATRAEAAAMLQRFMELKK